MDNQLLQSQSVSASKLLDLIGEDYLQSLADELQADKWVIKLRTKTVFSLLIYSLLESNRVSLRSMQDTYSSAIFKAIEKLAAEDSTAHSSIRDRLAQVKLTYFEAVYQRVYRLLEQHYDQATLSKYNLKRYDSTMIGVFAHLTTAIKVGNSSHNKQQVNLTTELTNAFGVRMQLFSDQPHLSEETALKEVIEQAQHTPKDLIVFDRGLKSRQRFKAFSQQGIQFVTRLATHTCYEVIGQDHPLPVFDHDKLELLSDQRVYLYQDGKKRLEQPFRLVRAINKTSGEELLFLTNLFDLPAYLVAYIYRQRWQIETFFRFMKQEMNLTHFVSHHANAIQVVLYCTLIAAMLVLVYRKQNQISSYRRAKIQFFKELQASVILEVLDLPAGPALLKKYFTQQAGKT